MYCLGHMSGVYRSIIRKEWNVVQHMVFAVMNTIINSQTFDSLAGPDGEITELLLRKKLAHSVKGYKQLEDFEVQVLANFCWRSALSIEDNRYAHEGKYYEGAFISSLTFLPQSVRNMLGPKGTGNTKSKSQSLGMQQFVTSMAATQDLSTMAMIAVFDVDRKRSYLERLFLSAFIRDELDHARQLRDKLGKKAKGSGDEAQVSAQSIELQVEDTGDSVASELQTSIGVNDMKQQYGPVQDMQQRLLKIEAEIAEHAEQGEQLRLQWQQRVVSMFDDHEKRLYACCTQVQHIQQLCDMAVGALKELTGQMVPEGASSNAFETNLRFCGADMSPRGGPQDLDCAQPLRK